MHLFCLKLLEIKGTWAEPFDSNLMKSYANMRRIDKTLLVNATHNLNGLFSGSENSKVFLGKLVSDYFLNQTFLKTKYVVCYGPRVLKPRADSINILPTKDTSIVAVIKYYPNGVVTNRFNF